MYRLLGFEPRIDQNHHQGPPPWRRSAAHAPSTRHARDAPPPHASTRHPTLHHARPDRHSIHSTTLQCTSPTMRQNSTANSTQHTPHGPSGPIGRLGAAGPRAPTQRAQNRTCASAHRGHSTQKAPAQVRSGPSWAHSTCCTRSHAACWSLVTRRLVLPSLPSALHAHTPTRARTGRARQRTARLNQTGSFRSRKCTWPPRHVAISGLV